MFNSVCIKIYICTYNFFGPCFVSYICLNSACTWSGFPGLWLISDPTRVCSVWNGLGWFSGFTRYRTKEIRRATSRRRRIALDSIVNMELPPLSPPSCAWCGGPPPTSPSSPTAPTTRATPAPMRTTLSLTLFACRATTHWCRYDKRRSRIAQQQAAFVQQIFPFSASCKDSIAPFDGDGMLVLDCLDSPRGGGRGGGGRAWLW